LVPDAIDRLSDELDTRPRVQHWLDKQAEAAGRPKEKLPAKQRASRKQELPTLAIKDLWSGAAPEALPNTAIEDQVEKWITAYCKKNNIRKPEISASTILRAAGRKQ
jgi:hypothetical protein